MLPQQIVGEKCMIGLITACFPIIGFSFLMDALLLFCAAFDDIMITKSAVCFIFRQTQYVRTDVERLFEGLKPF